MDDSRTIDDTEIAALSGVVRTARLSTFRKLIAEQLKAHWTLVKFAMVGGLGYVIYTGLLFVMYDLSAFAVLPDKESSVHLLLFTHGDALLLITTLVGTQASIAAVFLGHALWTFSDRSAARKPLWFRFLQFEAKALVSTLGILTVAVNVMTVGLGWHPYIAVPVSLVTAFSWNWLWDSRFIWRNRSLAASGEGSV